MTGTTFGDLGGALFVGGGVLGDFAVSFFVAGAAFADIWVDSPSAKCFSFHYKMRCRGGKSNLGERTGSALQFHGRIMFGSWSDHGRIGRALELTLQLFSANFSYILECNFAWQAQYLVMPVASRFVNGVSYVTRINDASHFSWQARYLVRLECDACFSAHCK